MIVPRRIVHSLLIISELIIICCCLIMIIKYKRTDSKLKVWMGSKILTFNKEIKRNNYELFPIFSFGTDGAELKYDQTYESLLKHSAKNCEKDYKKCGILDTYGNIMCIPKEKECPINDIIVDLEEKYNEYISKEYQKINLNNLAEGYSLYYTNTATDKEIIVKIKYNDEIPRFINKENFIFDEDAFKKYAKSGGFGGGGGGRGGGGGGGIGSGGGGIGSGGGGFRNLEEEVYGSDKMTEYIKKKFEEDINIDKSFKKIHDNLYAGNYIGFKDLNHMKNYSNFDLHKSYFTVFPDILADFFCYWSIIAFIGLIVFSFIRFCHNDYPGESFDPSDTLCGKLWVIIPYLTVFIGYFIYIIYEYINIYKKRNPQDLMEIRADEFIETLLAKINERHTKEVFIFAIIILFSCSMFLFLLAWIISYIATARYLEYYINDNW